MSLATTGSVLHPSYLGLPQAGPRSAFSGGWRGALLLILSSATACALLGPPSTTLILNIVIPVSKFTLCLIDLR